MSNDPQPTASAPLPLTFKQRLARKLFPRLQCAVPEIEGGHQDVFGTEVTVKLSWADRLRVLASGWIKVETRSATENKIGRNMTNGAFMVLPPDYLEEKI